MLYMNFYPFTMLVVIIFGLIMGSFLGVCIKRIPSGSFWGSQRSICPQCGHKISFFLNIPLLSFLLLRGRSFCCKKKISFFYPTVELITALLLVFSYYSNPFFSFYLGSDFIFDKLEFFRFLHKALFSCLMIVCSGIDFDHKIIPDLISLPMILLTPLVVLLHPELSWTAGLLGVFLGGGLIYLIAWIYFLIRKEEGIGMGDAKLLAAIGGWLGYQSILPVLLYSSLLGSFFGLLSMIFSRNVHLKSEIPFGPFLAIGSLFYLFGRIYLNKYFIL